MRLRNTKLLNWRPGMNKRVVLFIFLGAVVGGLFGLSYAAASNDSGAGIAVGAMAGAFLGWYAGAGRARKQG
jgi:hypothetical protein